VNEAPRTCDFQSAPDYAHSYYGVRVEPVNASGVAGGQNNVDYTWIFATGGTLKSKDVNAAVSYDLHVMSIEGKMVSTRTVANEGVMVLNTDGLSNGVYLVQVMSGDKQVTKKITVQK